MASGLEVLGAVAASLELVKVAKSCLLLFNDLRHVEIQDMERRGLQFHFYVQGVRFERWCSCLGVQDMFDLSTADNTAWTRSKRVESFEGVLQSQLHFKNSKYAHLTLSVLGDIRKKLGEADIIMSKYSGTSAPTTPTTTKGNGSRLSTRWSRLTGKSREGTKSNLSVVDSADDLSVSRLKIGMSSVQWLTHDKSVAQELLESIGRINDSLVELLGPSLQAQISRRSNMAILENLHVNSQNIRNLPEGSDLRALANMKEWQAQDTKEGCNDANSLKSNITSGGDVKLQKPPTFSVQDFEQNSLRTGDSRSFSTLSGEPVVIEWRYYSNKRPLKLEYSFRLMHLVGLLNQSNLYKKFTALPCKGLVDDRDDYRIGIVFAMETSSTTTAKSLQDVIHRSSRTPPPIGERFLIAKRFAIGIHNLHAAQWLHKGIRSDNVRHHDPGFSGTNIHDSRYNLLTSVAQIICLQNPPKENQRPLLEKSLSQSESEVDLLSGVGKRTADLGSLRGAPEPLAPFHLLGWDLSRPDHPMEFSESISISMDGFQTRRENMQMYKHPDLSRPCHGSAERRRFEVKFDIYSAGLVLLEIGLWRNLGEIRRKFKTDEEFRYQVRTEYCDRLQPVVGLTYWRAVQRCLNDDFGVPEGLKGSGDYSRQVGFEKHVVCELEKCFA